jgi:hypothetical protein
MAAIGYVRCADELASLLTLVREDGPREQPVPEKPLPHEQALQTEEEKKTLSRGDGQG